MDIQNGAYFEKAKAFCAWAEGLTELCAFNAKDAILKLMEMYELSSHLKYPESCEDIEVNCTQTVLPIAAAQDAYWEVQNPYACEEPVCASLKDDISSIYNELREGILLYEQAHFADALWHWKWNFEHHWKYHAVDAIRALNHLDA